MAESREPKKKTKKHYAGLRRLFPRPVASNPDKKRLLFICAPQESGSHARMIQAELGNMPELDWEVAIGTGDAMLWRQEVEEATCGVVLLQTRDALKDPRRLLQLFLAILWGHSVACVNIIGGGWESNAVPRFLFSLSSELPSDDLETLRTALADASCTCA